MTEPAKKPVRRRTSAPRREEPEDYKGGRVVVVNTVPCGWCMTGYHGDQCKHETSHYDRLWICPCECNAGWVPQDVGSGEIFLDPPKKRAATADGDEPEEDDQPSELRAKNGTVRRKPGR